MVPPENEAFDSIKCYFQASKRDVPLYSMHSNLHVEIQLTVKAKEQIVLKLTSKSDSLELDI
jgi:hypothetical protein